MSIADIADLHDQLSAVFKAIKNRFFYRTDALTWDQLEHWESASDIPDDGMIIADCDGFALACRKACRQAGIDNHRLVECRTERGRRHLVLECQGWVLDNRQVRVTARQELDYTWLRISGHAANDPWHEVKE